MYDWVEKISEAVSDNDSGCVWQFICFIMFGAMCSRDCAPVLIKVGFLR